MTEELRANKAKEALEIQSMQLKQGMVTPQQQTNIDNLRNERAKRLGDIKYDERNTLTKSGLDSIAKAKQAIASNQFTTAAMFDTQTIQAVTKVMDPGVTHPPEYDRIAKAGGLDSMIQLLASGNLKEYYSKFASNTLSTSQRHAAESILNDYKNTIELQRTQIDRDISSMAKTGGINPAHVIPFYQETADTTKDRPTDVAPARVTYSSAAEALRAKKGK